MDFRTIEEFAKSYFENSPPSTIKETLGFTADHERVLPTLAPLVKNNIERLITDFYKYVLNHDRAIKYFEDEAHIRRLQAINRSSFVQMFAGPFEETYFTQRMRVGFAHYRIRLSPDIYVGALRRLNDAFTSLWKDVISDATAREKANAATESVIYLELFLTLTTYFNLSQQDLESARQGTREILDHLGEGFFTIERGGTLGPIASQSCQAIFGQPLAGKRLAEAIKASRQTIDGLSYFSEQTFENLLPIDVNLSLLPAQIQLDDGKLVNLRYTPVLDNAGEPQKIIATAVDVTESTRRTQELEAEARHNRCLLTLLRQRTSFIDFINETSRDLERLAASPNAETGKRLLHTLKGNCASFGLLFLSERVHELEGDLGEIPQNKLALSFTKASAELTNLLDNFLNANYDVLGIRRQEKIEDKHEISEGQLETLEKAAARVTEAPVRMALEAVLAGLRERTVASLAATFASTVARLAEKLEKQIRFEIVGGTLRVPPERVQPILRQMVHALRNACDHGIELPHERLAAGKPQEGRILLQATAEATGELTLALTDDGRGINLQRLGSKAVEKGLVSEAWLHSATRDQIFNLIFADGVSTAESVTQISGRGVGMSALKEEVLGCGGRLKVESEPGMGMRLSITIPLRTLSLQKVA